MKKIFGNILCDNLTDDEYITLRKLKRKNRTAVWTCMREGK